MKIPKIGESIYIPSSFYITHGRDDILGGLSKISEVILSDSLPQDHSNYCFVKIEGFPKSKSWNYKILLREQAELQREFGKSKSRPDPDLSPEHNPPNYGWS